MRASDQILELLDRPSANQNRYGIDDVLGNMRGVDMTLEQLQHYAANRRAREQCRDEESVFEELTRLAMQADEETTDAFARITNSRFDKSRAEKLAATEIVRRCERRVGQLVKQGQQDGSIRSMGQTQYRQPVGRDQQVGPAEAAGLKHRADLAPLKVMADAQVEQFDAAIESAKAEGNLSRANVVRKLKGEAILFEIAYGMLRDGWAEHEVRYALDTLGTAV